MMGGSPGGWMMSAAGYQWMTGGTSAPGWMRGGTLPGSIIGTSAGTHPGRSWAACGRMPRPRVNPAQATTLSGQVLAGARIDRTADSITFTAIAVRLSHPGQPFRRPG